MRLRLVLLSIASTALYALVAVRSDGAATDRLLARWYRPSLFEASAEFYLIWLAVVVLYAVAVHVAASRSDRAVVTIVFLTSIAFRAALFLGNGFDTSTPDAFLHGPSPLSTLVERLGLVSTAGRIAATLADLAALALAPGLLRRARIPAGAMIVHGWNPLVVKEVAGSGRMEVIALLALVLVFRLIPKGARGVAALVYGASLTGPLALAASLPVMARALGVRLVLGLGASLLAWNVAFSGKSWAERALWPPQSSIGGSVTPALIALAGLFVTRNALAPLVTAFIAWGSVAAMRAARWSDDSRLPAETLVAVGGLLFVAPQVLPWSFLAVAYLAAYSANRGWIAFTATAPLTYLAFSPELGSAEVGGWSFWLGFAQYFGPFTLLIYHWLGRPPPKAAG